MTITQSYAKRCKYPPTRKSNFKTVNERHRPQRTTQRTGRLSGDFRNHKSPLHRYYRPSSLFFYNILFYFTVRRCRFDVFLQLTSIPARGGNASRSTTERRAPKQTSLISQEPLDAQIVHDFRFTVTPLSSVHVGWKLRPVGPLSSEKRVHVIADWHSWLRPFRLVSIIINISLRCVHHTRRRTVFSLFFVPLSPRRTARTDTGMRVSLYTIRNNINIQFSSREALHIFTLWGGTAEIRSRHEGVAHLNLVQGTSSLNRWPYPAKGRR